MNIIQSLAVGIPVTIAITVCSFALGSVLAVFLALGIRSQRTPLRLLSQGAVDVLRGIPPVVFLFIIFFGIGNQLVTLTPMTAAILGLALISAGHLAEIYRGGLNAVHNGQFEASAALGIKGTDTLGRVIAPQALRVALPGMTTYAISLIKDSSIVSTIGVVEIMFIANQSARSSGDGLLPFLLAAAIYILLGAPLAWVSRVVENKLHMRISR